MAGDWEELERPAPDAVTVGGRELRAGARVRLHPRPSGDVFDLVLDGRTALVEAIEQDLEGRVTLAVVVEDDPGRDLGLQRQVGHRFFFSPAELEPLDEARAPTASPTRTLVAGVGNLFLGDDGFGVALAERLARRRLPDGVDVVDFGIRGMDLAFAMQDGYDAVVLLDAVPRGQRPGTLYVIEAGDEDQLPPAVDGHGMDPVSVLALVATFGATPPRTWVIGCEPGVLADPGAPDVVVGLSEAVRAALDPAVKLVESLLTDIIASSQATPTHPKEAPTP